jgi:hypothetical protein
MKPKTSAARVKAELPHRSQLKRSENAALKHFTVVSTEIICSLKFQTSRHWRTDCIHNPALNLPLPD